MMKSDILFFNPIQTKNGICLENRILLWIASCLIKNGLNAKVFYLNKDFKTTIRKALLKYKPKYVAVSCKWYTNLYGAILVASEVKKIDRTIKVIAGGNTASYFGKELLGASDFDMVILGDAELPLLNILKNRNPINCIVKENARIFRCECRHSQAQQELNDYALIDPRLILTNPRNILKNFNFVWTIKGCTQNCFYCSGSAKVQKKIFGRTGLIYRPIKNVLQDITILSQYSKFLQFDSPTDKKEEIYWIKLFGSLPPKKFTCKFCSWHIPSKNFIDKISETFTLAIIVLDTSTLCEELRVFLSKKKWLKSFFSNKDLENSIQYCNDKRNILIELHNIAGLPRERNSHVIKHTNFAQYLIHKYPAITEISYVPLSIEPGAMLQKYSRKFNMHCCRNSFNDFLTLTQYAFEFNVFYPFNEFLLSKKYKIPFPHPYGVYEIGFGEETPAARASYFHNIIDKELKANDLQWEYIRKQRNRVESRQYQIPANPLRKVLA